MRKILFSIGIAALLNVFAYAQEPQQDISSVRIEEIGLPFISSFTPDDYKAFNQNWGAVQDSLGIMYFANGHGVLMYDGVHWEIIPLPNRTHAKSLTVDKDNRIYVGASGEFGYLKPDVLGKMHYVSLVPNLEENDRIFSTVWNCLATPQGVYFETNEALFRWSEKGFKVWKSPEGFRRTFFVHDILYTFIPGKGLKYIDEEDRLSLVPGSEQFADEGLTVVLPYDDTTLLVGTYTNGLFLFKDGIKKRFVTDADDFFSKNKLYAGTKLSNGDYALGTLTEGIIIISANGQQLLSIRGNEILVSDIIHHLYQDREGLIWASLNDGIAKIEYPFPFTIFGKFSGINDRVQLITRFQDKLLVGMDIGLYFLDNGSSASSFKLFQNVSDQVWDLLNFDGILLVGLRDGVYQIRENTKLLIGKWLPSAFYRSKIDRNRVFISLADGLRSIYYQNGQWMDEGKLEGITGSTYTIIEMNSGDLWLETSEAWVWKVSFGTREKAKELENPKIEKYGTEQGLPGDLGDIYFLDNNLYFVAANDQETFEFNPNTNRFQPAHKLHQKLKIQEDNIVLNHIDEFKNIWFSTNEGGQLFNWVGWFQKDGHYLIENLEQSRIIDHIGGSGSLYFESKDSILWLTGEKSILRHDLKFKGQKTQQFHALIRKVIYKGDSLLVQGNYHSSEAEVPFKGNNFRFQYASPGFYGQNANQFQYFLEGYDQDWSSWSKETQKDYTNLPEGDYVFRVKARNINNQLSEEVVYAFTILSPWYRTWWAYLLYALAFVGFVRWVVQWRSARLRQEKEMLENIVKERTQQLERQAEQLKEMDQMKSRLFANISHEFRTPLTLIKGPVTELVKTRKENLRLSDAQMINRNADRLLRLVNQLLDLSKLDAGNLELEPEAGDIHQFLRALAAAFSSHAEQRGMIYQIAIPQDALYASFDHDKLEKIVYNLLSNAFKFTPDGCVVTINASYSNAQLELKVKDRGRGIAPEQLPYIFDRFYQTDSASTREQEGTGIGLALTKELVSLMDGEMSVQSESGKGTAFTVTLPLTAMAITEQEVAEKEMFTQHAFEENIVPEKEMPVADGKRKQEVPMVLIVEDNADMRNFIQEQLNNEYEILEAAHGQSGLDIAQQEIPDLIITDLMMPQMDGMELCEQLKTDERTSHIPVIMLTAKAGQKHKIEGLETGADDYLTKPFDRQELQVRVKNLITQRQALRKRFSREVILEPRQIAITSLDEQFLQKVMELLEKNLSDTAFGMAEMQEALAMSKTQLYRKIKALTDQSPGEFIRNYRLKRAAQILSHQGDNVTQVAYAVGFNNLSYFAKCFKELYGVAPSVYSNQS